MSKGSGWSRGLTKETSLGVAKRSISALGRKGWAKGLTKDTSSIIAIAAEKRKGKTKGSIPWNKGLTKYDCVQIAKISADRMGKTKENTPYVASQAKKLIGRTKENDKSVASGAKKRTGRTKETHPSVARAAEKKRGRNKFNDPSVARAAEKKKQYTGDKSPGWKGGISFLPYSKEFNKQRKEYIRKRDEYTCQRCGINEFEHGHKLHVHHIDYDKLNASEYNLIGLCNCCNSSVNFNREFWQRFFTDKLTVSKNSGEIVICG
jgi:5-methylcytosine-specific restriction endonuclease McrA